MDDEFCARYVINQNDKFMVVLPPTRTVTDGEFYIIPIEHTSDSTQLDSETLTRIHNLFRNLITYLGKSNKSVICVETYHDSTKRTHMIIDCFIFEKSEVSDLKIYFKKALSESDVEWSNHKKLLVFKGSKFYEKVNA
ncbi:CWF19-like protein 2 [Thelohanellus kitauei]|uniref:CWF19-like protein 2 n=1 Tax=Thelohanellus kitauei TaxID=669202 RepID=A0A0C2MLB7_THEKT|nr:CWF19-like protein 2 [Thelohanellus kitauei]